LLFSVILLVIVQQHIVISVFKVKTRLPARPTTRGHFRSHHHAIRHIRKPHMLHAKFMSVFYRTGVIVDRSFTLGNKDFRLLLLLWPWPWRDNFHNTNLTRILSRYTRSADMNFIHKDFQNVSSIPLTDIQKDRQTDRQTRPT